jgi:hypothetical protein
MARIFCLQCTLPMHIMRFMHENKRPLSQPQESHKSKSLDARVAAMRARGMSATAIGRALGLSDAAALAAGLLVPGRLMPVSGPGPGAGAASARGPGGPGPRDARMVAIRDAVTRGTGIDREALIAPGQRQPEVRARHLAMCLIRELCPGVSLAAIGKVLDRDPSTVLYGCRRAEALRRRDRAFRDTYLRIRHALIAGCSEGGIS